MPELADKTIRDMADALLRSYDLVNAYKGFTWQRVGLPEAYDRRLYLEKQTRGLDADAGFGTLLRYVDEVHRWGFGRPLPTKLRSDEFLETLRALLLAWRVPGLTSASRPAKLRTLAELMSWKGLKIATASKFICFVDQSTYAIYDSRVSVALAKVIMDKHSRFPIVGRRVPKGKTGWTPNLRNGDPAWVAEQYWRYLAFLDVVKGTVDQERSFRELGKALGAAEIEMALFMLGNVWPANP